MTARTFLMTSAAIAACAWSGQALGQEQASPAADPATGQSSSDDQAPAPAADDQAIVVTGIRASLDSARNKKRNSDSILDAIAAEDINELPDDTATEAIARLPDVQVSRNRGEGQAIFIRGLPQIQTTLNGQEIFTGSARRALLDNYPADIIGGIQVYRAQTPDLVEGGIGGTVNIDLRKPFDFNSLTVAGAVRASFDDQSRKISYNGDLLFVDRWQTGLGEIGLLVNASYHRRNYLESYRENGQRTTVKPGQVASPAGLADDLVYPTTLLIKHPRGYFSRPVVTAALEWKPAYNLDLGFRATLISDTEVNNDDDFTTKVQGSNPTFTDVSVVPGSNVISGATFVATSPSGPRSSYQKAKAKTNQYEFSARYLANDLTLSTNAIYSTSNNDAVERVMLLAFNTPPTIDAQFQSDTRYGGLAYQYVDADPLDLSGYHVRAYSDAIASDRSSDVQWRTDLDVNTGSDLVRSLKFGVRYTNRKAAYDYGSRLANLDPYKLPVSAYPGGDDPEIIDPGFHGDDADIPASWVGYRGGVLGDEGTYRALNAFIGTLPGQDIFAATALPILDPLKHFDGHEKSYAAYGQFKYGFDAFGVPIDGVVGARVVKTDLSINGFEQVTSRTPMGTTVEINPIHGDQNYTDFDPSVSAVLHFTRGLQLRLAWTKTFSRPDFSQLNPTTNLSQVTASNGAYLAVASTGNPDLEPIRSTNWDASLEYYFGKNGSLSLALFKKDLQGFIVNTSTTEDFSEASGPVTVTRPVNGSDGTIRGLEVSASTFFDFLPGAFQRFGVSANYTYLDTDQTLPATDTTPAFDGPLTKVSKHNANVQLFYQHDKIKARLAYAYRGKFTYLYNLSNRDNDLVWYPVTQLDAKVSYRFRRRLELTLDVRNLLARPQRASWGPRDFTDRVYFEGRVYSAALRFKF